MGLTDFQSVLRNDERMTWSGRAPRGVRLRAADIFLIPFSLLWGGFAIFWEASVIGIGAAAPHVPTTTFMSLWGIPFVAVGLYMIFGRFLVDAWVRERTSYALTSQRALIRRARFGYSLSSIELAGKPIRLTELKADGRGTLEFGEQISLLSGPNRMGSGMWAPWLVASSFYDVENAEDLFRKAQDVAGQVTG